MRIIAGKYRSRRLTAPKTATRPTSDRLRETLFNVLAPQLEGSVWIDLFAGSGAVGIEALSRGAAKAYFVENEKGAARAIRANLDALGEANAEILQSDAAPALRSLEARGIVCDICFLDPPYAAHGTYAQVLRLLSESELVGAGSLVIAEHDKHFDPGGEHGRLQRVRELKQGDALLSFYRREM